MGGDLEPESSPENAGKAGAGQTLRPFLGSPYPIDPLYEARLRGFCEGWDARQGEIDRLNYTADRLYTEMCRRPAPPTPNYTSFAELQRRREEIYTRTEKKTA